jgi:hypothetical protein
VKGLRKETNRLRTACIEKKSAGTLKDSKKIFSPSHMDGAVAKRANLGGLLTVAARVQGRLGEEDGVLCAQ